MKAAQPSFAVRIQRVERVLRADAGHFLCDGTGDGAGDASGSAESACLFKRDGSGDASGVGRAALRQNLLMHGDNLHALSALTDGPLREACAGLKLVYLDPPFAVGTDFTIPVLAGAALPAGLPAVAYSDAWAHEEDFYTMLFDRLTRMRDLLAEDGSIYVHCDWRTHARIRLFMDALFGRNRFLGEIIWHYTGGGRANRYFSRKHDTLLHYAKSKNWIFNVDAVRVPFKESSGYAKGGITSAAGKHYRPNPLGTPVDDVWDIPIVNPMSAERQGYPTQKPEALLERIIAASSNPGDTVMDLFCGSGTTAAVAERLGRRWIVADAGPFAVQATYKRLTRLMRRAAGAKPPRTPLPKKSAKPFSSTAGREINQSITATGNGTTGFDLLRIVPAEKLSGEENGTAASRAIKGTAGESSAPPACTVALSGHTLSYGAPEITLRIRRAEHGFQAALRDVYVGEMHVRPTAGRRRRTSRLSLKNNRLFWDDQPLMRDAFDWIDAWSVCLYAVAESDADAPKAVTPPDEAACLVSYPVYPETGNTAALPRVSPWIPLPPPAPPILSIPPVPPVPPDGALPGLPSVTDREPALRPEKPHRLLWAVRVVDIFAREQRVFFDPDLHGEDHEPTRL